MKVRSEVISFVSGLLESLLLPGKLAVVTSWERFVYVGVAPIAKKGKITTLAADVQRSIAGNPRLSRKAVVPCSQPLLQSKRVANQV